MKIAILSGKGGAGKTFTSVNLALTAGTCMYVDCDVEAPNGGLFLQPQGDVTTSDVTVETPCFDADLCTKCRACVDFCAFGALAFIGTPLLFDEICHSCGGCLLVCPSGAVSEKSRCVGQTEEYACGSVSVLAGRMSIGESSGMPIIHRVLREAALYEAGGASCEAGGNGREAGGDSGEAGSDGGIDAAGGGEGNLVILDCPPGTACSAAECVKNADYCVIVAEPSVYGAHNLRMAHDLVEFFGKPCGVVLNKSMPGENPSEEVCRTREVPILANIPFDRDVALALAEGRPAVEASPRMREVFQDLLNRIRTCADGEVAR